MSTTLDWRAEYSKLRWELIVTQIWIISSILDSQDEWIFFTYPLDYLGVRTDIDIECGGPSFRSSHPEMSPTGQYLTGTVLSSVILILFAPRLPGDNSRELPTGPRGAPLDQPRHWQLPAGAGARARLPPHHRPPELNPGPQETGAAPPRWGQIIQIIRVSSPSKIRFYRCTFCPSFWFYRCIRNRLSECAHAATGSCLTGRGQGGGAVGGAAAWWPTDRPASSHPAPPASWPRPPPPAPCGSRQWALWTASPCPRLLTTQPPWSRANLRPRSLTARVRDTRWRSGGNSQTRTRSADWSGGAPARGKTRRMEAPWTRTGVR